MKALLTLLLIVIAVVGGVGLWNRLDEQEPGGPKVAEPSKMEAPRATPKESRPPIEAEEAAPASEVRTDPHARSRELDALNDRGIELLGKDDFPGAIELFETCFAERPEVEAYAFNLSEGLSRLATDVYQEGSRAEALELLARAAELAPNREALGELLARWRKRAAEEEELWQYETDHFELVFDSERSDILFGAQDVLDVLEAAYLEFSSLFSHDPIASGRERIRVVLTSRSDFQRATGLGEWAGGAYDGTIRLPTRDLNRERASWTRILRHELGHVWMRELGGRNVPGWLNEGLCQWLEGDRVELIRGAKLALENHKLFDLAELTGSLIKWNDAAEVGRAYAQAFLFLESLVQTYGIAAVLEMATGCKAGIDPAVSFERVTLISLSVAFDDFIGTLPK